MQEGGPAERTRPPWVAWAADGPDGERAVLARDGGRRLVVHLDGPEDGDVLVHHHGTPGCGRPDEAWRRAAARHGLRWVGLSRPGYDGSDRLAGRDVASVAADVEAVLDALGVRAAYVSGWSGGGPHALATAALLPGRVRAVAVVAGVAPWDADGLDVTAGMGAANLTEFGAAQSGEHALRPLLDAEAAALRDIGPDDLCGALGTLLPEPDVRALQAGAAGWLAASFHAALAGGVDGWLDDDLAFVRPWGVDLAALAGTPVTLWFGDADLMVPPAHGAWLARHVPHADARPVPGEGHVSLLVDRADQVVDALVAAGR